MQASCPLTPTSGGLFPLDERFSSALLRTLAPRRLGKPAQRTKRRFGASSGEQQHIGEEEETQAVTFRDAIIMMMIQDSRNMGRAGGDRGWPHNSAPVYGTSCSNGQSALHITSLEYIP